MLIHLIQKNINNTDYVSLLANVNSKPDLVCLGELAVSGCLYNGGSSTTVEPIESVLGSLIDYDFAIMLGLPRKQEDRLYNSYVYYDQGQHQVYDKINLFEPMKEISAYVPGKIAKTFDTRFGKIGALICYDLRFPELFGKLASQGARIIFVAAAWPNVRIGDWQELLVKRAVDTKLFIVGINAVGDDGTNVFGGSSMVVNPRGEILAQADETSETFLEVEI